MQPVPVQISKTEIGRLDLDRTDEIVSPKRVTQSSVSGRGIRVGGRHLMDSGPNGWLPNHDVRVSEVGYYGRIIQDSHLGHMLTGFQQLVA